MEMKTEKIWQALESDTTFQTGLLFKRFSPDVLPDVYVALKAPEKLRCIAIRINRESNIETDQWNNLRDIKIEIYPDHQITNKKFLLILLLNSDHKDIFSTLSEDLISGVQDSTDEEILMEDIFARLIKWQALFEKAGAQGLSEENQRGVYGELIFLKKFIENTSHPQVCISSWKGPEKAIQDFQGDTWALEVKTTHGKNHQKIHITSERQLDTEIIPNIFLYHLSLDLRDHTGETLNELVDKILSLISKNYQALNAFKLKLLSAGYYDIHRKLYANTGYTIRQQRIFQVVDDFPRITERQISGGVGDVRYSIVLADEVPWKISEQELFLKISE